MIMVRVRFRLVFRVRVRFLLLIQWWETGDHISLFIYLFLSLWVEKTNS